MAEHRYLVSRAFWEWCHENEITAAEIGAATGYSASLVKHVRLHGTWRTVSQQFVDRVEARYIIPEGMVFFSPANSIPVRVNGRFAPRHRPKQTLGRS